MGCQRKRTWKAGVFFQYKFLSSLMCKKEKLPIRGKKNEERNNSISEWKLSSFIASFHPKCLRLLYIYQFHSLTLHWEIKMQFPPRSQGLLQDQSIFLVERSPLLGVRAPSSGRLRGSIGFIQFEVVTRFFSCRD